MLLSLQLHHRLDVSFSETEFQFQIQAVNTKVYVNCSELHFSVLDEIPCSGSCAWWFVEQ